MTMSDEERKALAKEIAKEMCEGEGSICPLGLTPNDAMKWQGMIKIAGIVGVAAAWTIVAAVAGGFVAAMWAGIKHFMK